MAFSNSLIASSRRFEFIAGNLVQIRIGKLQDTVQHDLGVFLEDLEPPGRLAEAGDVMRHAWVLGAPAATLKVVAPDEVGVLVGDDFQ